MLIHSVVYSPGGAVASLSAGGVLRVWNNGSVALSQKLSDNLSNATTCMSWKDEAVICLGSEKGVVTVINTLTGDLLLEQAFLVSPILGMRWSEDALFCCYESGVIAHIDSTTWKMQSQWWSGAKRCCSIAHINGYLITAGRAVKVWSADTEGNYSAVATYYGHSTDVITLSVTEDSGVFYIYSIAKDDFVINVWKFSASSVNAKRAYKSVICRAFPKSISVCGSSGLIVTAAGFISRCTVDFTPESSKSSKSQALFKIADSKSQLVSYKVAKMVSETTVDTVYGIEANLRFERFELDSLKNLLRDNMSAATGDDLSKEKLHTVIRSGKVYLPSGGLHVKRAKLDDDETIFNDDDDSKLKALARVSEQ